MKPAFCRHRGVSACQACVDPRFLDCAQNPQATALMALCSRHVFNSPLGLPPACVFYWVPRQ